MTDVLVIGQGLAGSWLAWWLEKYGLTFRVADPGGGASASSLAAGLINPVTGRRLVATWMIGKLLPFAREAYRTLGATVDAKFLRETSLVDFFPGPQMLLAFRDRLAQDTTWLEEPADQHAFDETFTAEFGYGTISPCLLVDTAAVLTAMRNRIRGNGALLETAVGPGELRVTPDGVEYGGETYRHAIYCDGIAAAESPWFRALPFAPNKGEALILRIPGLAREKIYKKAITLAPWRDDLFWAGSSYEWAFADDRPSAAFRTKTEAQLKYWLKIPFEIVDHIAAVRPATIERRPFVGLHPVHPAIGMLNGLGTKGCSLAPWFARELAAHLKERAPIRPDADLQRFSRILSRESPRT